MPKDIRSFQDDPLETDLARDAQAQHLARFTGAPAPRTVPARVLDFLERQKADYAIARLRFETRLLDEIEAEMDGLNARLFKFQEADQNLRVSLLAARDRRALGRDPSNVDVSVFERDLSDNADRRASVMQRQASLQAKARSLNDRLRASNKLILGQGLSGALTFLPLPAVNAKTTLRQVRERITDMRAELADVEVAPIPSSLAREQLARWVERNARSINVRPLLERGERNGAPYVPKVLLPASGGGAVEGESAVGLLCWLFRDELVKKLGEQIDRAQRDDEALSPDDWSRRIAELKAKILESERLEEAIAWDALQAGKDVDLRADVNARAILAVSDGRS